MKFPKHCLQYGVLTFTLKEYEMYRRPQSYQITVTKVLCPGGDRRPQSYQSITSDPAPWDPKVSLFTVIPPLPRWWSAPSKLPKYRYLQWSRSLGSQSIAIYSDPASAQVVIGALKVTKVSLFTMIPLLGFPKYRYLQCPRPCPGGDRRPQSYQSIGIYNDPAPWVPDRKLF